MPKLKCKADNCAYNYDWLCKKSFIDVDGVESKTKSQTACMSFRDSKDANNDVEFASFDFMKNVIQSTRNIKIPMGAGPYKATDNGNSDTPSESAFYMNNVVYFKANNNFHTTGAKIENAKIDKVRYQVVSSANAIAALESGSVHYISPSLTTDNFDKLENLKSKGIAIPFSSKTLTLNRVTLSSNSIRDPSKVVGDASNFLFPFIALHKSSITSAQAPGSPASGLLSGLVKRKKGGKRAPK